jgi:hypothetical protein
MERVPGRAEGHSLDLDSTVFERHGEQQEEAMKGYNPRRPGRLSHHPLLAVLAESHFIMHAWLRRGNSGTGRGATAFLTEALALWGERGRLRVVRADAGFFDDELLTFLEERQLPYIVSGALDQECKAGSEKDRRLEGVRRELRGGGVCRPIDGLEDTAASGRGQGTDARWQTLDWQETD